MKRALVATLVVLGVLSVGVAWAGGGGQPPGGGEGGSGAEPELYALILFSLLPGIFFARRALTSRRGAEEA